MTDINNSCFAIFHPNASLIGIFLYLCTFLRLNNSENGRETRQIEKQCFEIYMTCASTKLVLRYDRKIYKYSKLLFEFSNIMGGLTPISRVISGILITAR